MGINAKNQRIRISQSDTHSEKFLYDERKKRTHAINFEDLFLNLDMEYDLFYNKKEFEKLIN